MDINEGYALLRFIANKTQSAYISPLEYEMLVNSVQVTVFNELLPGSNINQAPGRTKYEETTAISDELVPFKLLATLTVDNTGKLVYPDDYQYLSSIRKWLYVNSGDPCKGDPAQPKRAFPVEVLSDDVLSHVLGSAIVGPEISKKKIKLYATLYDYGIQFFPRNIGEVDITYLRTPAPIVYAFTVDPTTQRAVYNSGASTQWEWLTQTQNEIIIRVLAYMGINMRSPDLVQAAQQLKMEGV